jgi:diguanylate cyclase (GGDEF)-like protein
LDRIRALAQAYRAVQGEATRETLQRFRALLLGAVPLHGALAWWFGQYQAPPGRPEMQRWADALSPLQMAMAVVLLLLGGLAHALLRRQHRARAGAVLLQAVFCLVYLAFGALAAILDVGVGNGIATFMLICAGIAVLSLMRPALSFTVFGLAFLVFWQMLQGAGVDARLLPSLQVQAISAVLMAQVVSVIIWHQYAGTVVLRRQLSRSNEALVAKQRELEFLAERDALTGLYNRRELMRLAEFELSQAARSPLTTCLVMVDLDFFKKINDQHGHPAGDEVLKQVAALLSAGVRASDVVARMGGEEFIVLLPNTSQDGAIAVAQKLRQTLRAQPLKVPVQGRTLLLPVTASFGVSSLGENQRASVDALYTAADQALYAAKQQGRDRVEYAAPQLSGDLPERTESRG